MAQFFQKLHPIADSAICLNPLNGDQKQQKVQLGLAHLDLILLRVLSRSLMWFVRWSWSLKPTSVSTWLYGIVFGLLFCHPSTPYSWAWFPIRHFGDCFAILCLRSMSQMTYGLSNVMGYGWAAVGRWPQVATFKITISGSLGNAVKIGQFFNPCRMESIRCQCSVLGI